jgi:hypothetical protein
MSPGDDGRICTASNDTVCKVLNGSLPVRFRNDQPGCLTVAPCDTVVRRFRSSNIMASSAPLSEPAQRITASEKEKPEEVMNERFNTSTSIPIIHEEDEQFEWREVIRGNFRRTSGISEPVSSTL